MKYFNLFFLAVFFSSFSYAQVGVNNTEIHPSAALDIQYGTNPKGLLTPRMTTAQRIAIDTPADGLIVYDADIKSFYHYQNGSTPGWVRMSSEATGRLNFKRIKSTDVLATVLAAELSDGGGSKYKLKTNTLYEINGTVVIDKPIDLNNAYLQGLDSGDDILFSAGNIFDGATGGTVKGLTVRSSTGKVFNINGANTENLIFRDCIVANSSSVGSINGLGLVFLSVVQFSGNTTGITYSNITQLLLSNIGWFDNNAGTFETLTGTFGLVQKQGGFSQVDGIKVGFDVSSNPTIDGDAVMESVVFTGAPTGLGRYVKGYTTGNYTGYNFNNSWTVNSPGIPREGDGDATGDINLSVALGNDGATTNFGTGSNPILKKVVGTTTSTSLFRFTKDGDNKIIYKGNKTRYFQVSASLSYQGEQNNLTLVLYIAKNGAVIGNTKVYGSGTTGILVTSGIVALPIVGTVQMKKDDYIEIWVQRIAGSGNMQTVSLNLTAR